MPNQTPYNQPPMPKENNTLSVHPGTIPSTPILWPVTQHPSNQIQQTKGSAKPQATGVQPTTQPNQSVVAPRTTPSHVSNVRVVSRNVGGQKNITVQFDHPSGDPYFSGAKVYLRSGTKEPVLVASGAHSPLTFTATNDSAPHALHVTSVGNWGETDVLTSPSAPVKLFGPLNVSKVNSTAFASGGGITPTPPPSSLSDGLTHPPTPPPWEADPGYVILRDDFHANLTGAVQGANIFIGLGQLGWNLQGSGGSISNAQDPGFFGGGGLHIGNFAWENGNVAEAAGFLMLAPINGSITPNAFHTPGSWALAETPESITTFVFKVDTDTGNTSPNLFSTAQKAMYVGYTGATVYEGITGSTFFSRPDVFVGVRYDTSPAVGPLVVTSVASTSGVYTGTFPGGGSNAYANRKFVFAGFVTNPSNNGTFVVTASTTTTITTTNSSSISESASATASSPGLADSFFTLEAVANPTYADVGRNNVQGSTYVTNVAPVAGVWHRVDIYFNKAGMVTITLDGSAVNTLTTAMPTISIAGTITGSVQNQKGLISWTVSRATNLPASPWNDSSVVTISGFTSGRTVLNGAQTLTASLNARFTFNSGSANVGGGSDTVSLVGYPSLMPIMIFGNDDQPSPTTQNMTFFIDYFSFIANANLGPNAPGTVIVGNSRYF